MGGEGKYLELKTKTKSKTKTGVGGERKYLKLKLNFKLKLNLKLKQVWAGRAEEREYLRKVSSHRELELEWSMLCQVWTMINRLLSI